jgi:hypothetical protein
MLALGHSLQSLVPPTAWGSTSRSLNLSPAELPLGALRAEHEDLLDLLCVLVARLVYQSTAWQIPLPMHGSTLTNP